MRIFPKFTNDISKIEQMSWTPFFLILGCGCTGSVRSDRLGDDPLDIAGGIGGRCGDHDACTSLFWQTSGKTGAACAADQAKGISRIKDLLSGYDVLRFFGKDDRFFKGVDEASDRIEQANYKLNVNTDCIGNGLSYVSAVCQMAITAIMGVLILNGSIPLATFMGAGNICAAVYNGLNQAAKLAVSFSASKPYFDKITVHAGEVSQPESRLPALQQGITVEDVSFCYDEKKPVLVHMDAQFKKGGKYALTGPSGCGKSTLLKILLGWLPEYRGTVRYDGQDVRAFTPEQLQQQMSYIEQDVFLFNTTIRENITLGETFTEEQLEKALRDSALAGDLAQMPQGLDTPVGRRAAPFRRTETACGHCPCADP